jgi:hypothetical protein
MSYFLFILFYLVNINFIYTFADVVNVTFFPLLFPNVFCNNILVNNFKIKLPDM